MGVHFEQAQNQALCWFIRILLKIFGFFISNQLDNIFYEIKKGAVHLPSLE